jgi:phytoene synthase
VRAALDAWRDEVARCFEHRSPRTPQGEVLEPLIGRFHLPRRPFDDLVDGVAMDVGERRYATFDELRDYCYRVASTVGLICLEIFGYEDPRSRDYAVSLGLALQLTNILRDVPDDLARGRLYIPTSDMQSFRCSEDDLRRGRLTEPVRALLAHQAARAKHFYAEARGALPAGDARRLVAAEIMGAIYRAVLEEWAARGHPVGGERTALGKPRKVWLALRTVPRVCGSS